MTTASPPSAVPALEIRRAFTEAADVLDVFYLINGLFAGGPPPV